MTGFVLLFLSGLFLSAFFSGSETGFYRVTRLRLVLDASEGSRVAKWLLQLTNNPSLFVATTLIGNNFANYLTSLAIVLMARSAVAGNSQWAELLAPLLMTPVVFVYGELLPKSLFFHAPNLLLRRCGPLFALFTVLFAPVSGLLWLLGRLLEVVLGQKPLRLQSQLARKELQQALEEGELAGLLRPAQQKLSQSLFDIAALPVDRLAVPLAKAPKVSPDIGASAALEQARLAGAAALLVSDRGQPAGFVRVIDLRLGDPELAVREHLRPLTTVGAASSHLAALIKLRTEDAELAEVVDDGQRIVGVIYSRDLEFELLKIR